MGELDWTSFDKRINIESTKVNIIDSWMNQENIEKWFLSDAQFYKNDGSKRDRKSNVEPGDTYIWKWYGSDFLAEGKILEVRNQESLKFTFLGCIVDVDVKTENNTHILQITQSKIPLDEESKMNLYVGCTSGWTFYAANLKSILEGGIDLRNKNKELTDVINT